MLHPTAKLKSTALCSNFGFSRERNQNWQNAGSSSELHNNTARFEMTSLFIGGVVVKIGFFFRENQDITCMYLGREENIMAHQLANWTK
jgi:hypothetical protein